ncbi:hypothetical protein MNBD_IGNAVI01-2347 [hydrothermal vent metagenome]|uniref:Outer membrane protein beta-barrel domain-containing protein n=1 Tax=hydrothermal vent metagenome TaxID=652676 RepID=A0A3B1C6B0_9ZZZZ
MKRLFILLIAIFITFNFTMAQKHFRIGAGFDVVFPASDYNDIAKTGVGGSLLMDYSFSPEIAITLSSTYSSHGTELPVIGIDGEVIEFNIKSIDVLLGGRYYVSPSFFGLLEAGVRYLQLYADIYKATDNNNSDKTTKYKPYYTAGFGLGYRYNLAEDKSDFEFTGIYHFVSGDVMNFPTFTLRASILIYL